MLTPGYSEMGLNTRDRFTGALRWLTVIVFIACFFSGTLEAEEGQPNTGTHTKLLRITIGQKTAVCNEYKKFLDSVADRLDPTGAQSDRDKLMCWRAIPSEFSKFSQPTWTEIDPRQRMDLAVSVKNTMESVWDGASTPARNPRSDEVRKGWLTINYEKNHDRWYVTRIDIDNDGQAEEIVKYRSGRCNDYPPDSDQYAIPTMVVDASGTGVDPKKTGQILGLTSGMPAATMTKSFDIFTFNEQNYVDRWENEGEYKGKATRDKTLSVYLNKREQRTLVCQFRLSK